MLYLKITFKGSLSIIYTSLKQKMISYSQNNSDQENGAWETSHEK